MQSDKPRQEADEPTDQESGVITALLDSATQILQRYSLQWETSKEMLQLEWAITRKSLAFALVALVFFGGVALSACIAVTAFVGYALYTQGMPVWSIGLTLIALHGLVLFALARTVRSLIRRMGFQKTFAILGRSRMARAHAASSGSADTAGEA